MPAREAVGRVVDGGGDAAQRALDVGAVAVGIVSKRQGQTKDVLLGGFVLTIRIARNTKTPYSSQLLIVGQIPLQPVKCFKSGRPVKAKWNSYRQHEFVAIPRPVLKCEPPNNPCQATTKS